MSPRFFKVPNPFDMKPTLIISDYQWMTHYESKVRQWIKELGLDHDIEFKGMTIEFSSEAIQTHFLLKWN